MWPVLPEGLPVDDPDLEPIWQAMDEADLPIMHHSFFYEAPYFPGYRDIWGNVAVARTAAHVWGAQRLMAYVLVSGMLDRYPESAGGHRGDRPRLAAALDHPPHQPDRLRQGRRARRPEAHPLEYVQMGRVFCAIEQHEGAEMTKAVIDILGDGVLMYESDFPHPECYYPNSTDNVISWGPVIGEEALRKLMADNAARYLRLLSDPFDDGPSDNGRHSNGR